jgi:hypothetical protein
LYDGKQIETPHKVKKAARLWRRVGPSRGRFALTDAGVGSDSVVCHKACELPTISVDNFVEKYPSNRAKAMLYAGFDGLMII